MCSRTSPSSRTGRRRGLLVYGEPDLMAEITDDVFPDTAPTDPTFANQDNLTLQQVDVAWRIMRAAGAELTAGDPAVRVATLDRGVDLNHPDIGGNLTDGTPQLERAFDFDGMRRDDRPRLRAGHQPRDGRLRHHRGADRQRRRHVRHRPEHPPDRHGATRPDRRQLPRHPAVGRRVRHRQRDDGLAGRAARPGRGHHQLLPRQRRTRTLGNHGRHPAGARRQRSRRARHRRHLLGRQLRRPRSPGSGSGRRIPPRSGSPTPCSPTRQVWRHAIRRPTSAPRSTSAPRAPTRRRSTTSAASRPSAARPLRRRPWPGSSP